ncbi:MAG: YcxB family protein [Oscillospiraceae bacterium]|nr:YcxB family protein [Oscillospiraceae bacterium]
MKYMSLSFYYEKGDCGKFSAADLFRASLHEMIRSKLWIPLAAVLIMVAVMRMFAVIPAMILIYLFIPVLVQLAMRKRSLQMFDVSEKKRRPVTVDFYGDHIVYCYGSCEGFRSSRERHIAFSMITTVLESPESFLFVLDDTSGFHLPKRVLGSEQEQMIRNLVENVFKDRYAKINK